MSDLDVIEELRRIEREERQCSAKDEGTPGDQQPPADPLGRYSWLRDRWQTILERGPWLDEAPPARRYLLRVNHGGRTVGFLTGVDGIRVIRRSDAHSHGHRA